MRDGDFGIGLQQGAIAIQKRLLDGRTDARQQRERVAADRRHFAGRQIAFVSGHCHSGSSVICRNNASGDCSAPKRRSTAMTTPSRPLKARLASSSACRCAFSVMTARLQPE